MKFEFVAGNLALDFANSVHSRGSPDPQDDLKNYEDLIGWCRQAGLLGDREHRRLEKGKSALAQADFDRTLELREAVYDIFSCIARGKNVHAGPLQRLNEHLGKVMARANLRNAGKRFELRWEGGGAVLQRVWGEITRSAVGLLTSDRLHRVRQCAGENCTWLFLDTSRNGLRRWCDMQACGNRAKVQRFRNRNVTG